MCPDTQDLLSLMAAPAEGAPPSSELAAHARECAACAQTLRAFADQRAGLRALPEVPAPAPSPALLQAPRAAVAPRWALAAAVAVVGVIGMWLTLAPDAQTPVAEMAQVPAVASPTGQTRNEQPKVSELQLLTIRSALLERQWQYLNRNAPRVRRVAHEANTAPLKSSLMYLDSRYEDLPESDYWRQRVQLLDTLVTLEQTERLVRNDARLGARPTLVRTL